MTAGEMRRAGAYVPAYLPDHAILCSGLAAAKEAGNHARAIGLPADEQELHFHLREMAEFDALAVARQFVEREGIRFDEPHFADRDVADEKQHVLILSGTRAKLFRLADERLEKRLAGKIAVQGNDRCVHATQAAHRATGGQA